MVENQKTTLSLRLIQLGLFNSEFVQRSSQRKTFLNCTDEIS